jgi:hypothetical protein
MHDLKRLGLAVASVAALTMIALTAHAQTGGAPGTAPKAAPAAKAPAATPAPKADATPKADAKKDAKKAPDTKKAGTTACNSMTDQTACAADATCQWIAAVKRKDGREVKAYCRTKPSGAKKSTTAKKS